MAAHRRKRPAKEKWPKALSEEAYFGGDTKEKMAR
jgi:hypothetical protein